MVLLLILILGLRVRGIVVFFCGSAFHAEIIALLPKLQIGHLLFTHFRALNFQLPEIAIPPQLLFPLYFSHFLLKFGSAEEHNLLTSRSSLTCTVAIFKAAPPAAADCALTTRLDVLTATDILRSLSSFLLHADRSSLNLALHGFEHLTANIPVADASVDLLQQGQDQDHQVDEDVECDQVEHFIAHVVPQRWIRHVVREEEQALDTDEDD